jgi:hypothetical protein
MPEKERKREERKKRGDDFSRKARLRSKKN